MRSPSSQIMSSCFYGILASVLICLAWFNLEWYQIAAISLGGVVLMHLIINSILWIQEEPALGYIFVSLFVIYSAVFWIRLAFGLSGTANWINAGIGSGGAILCYLIIVRAEDL
jgi:hypothetical protein